MRAAMLLDISPEVDRPFIFALFKFLQRSIYVSFPEHSFYSANPFERATDSNQVFHQVVPV